jgi:hypothetical protein
MRQLRLHAFQVRFQFNSHKSYCSPNNELMPEASNAVTVNRLKLGNASLVTYIQKAK